MKPEVLFGTTDRSVLLEKTAQLVRTMQNLQPGSYEPDPASGAIMFKAQQAPQDTVDQALGLLAKSLSPDQISQIQQSIGDITKDLTPTSPLSSGYVAYDLDPVIAILRFLETPLRNSIPRTKGMGKSYQFKRITGTTGLGGPGNISPFDMGITDTTQTRFDNPSSSNALYYNRPAKISYAGDESNLPYVQTGLSDELSWSTQFQALGFTDLRAMSRTSLMLSHMSLEERRMLLGRGTGSGYLGALGRPVIASVTARDPATGETAVTGGTTTIYVKAAAIASSFQLSNASASAGTVSVASGKVYDVVITDVSGAVGYKVYASTGASDPGDASRFYVGQTGSNKFTIQGALPSSGDTSPTSDTSAFAQSFDGIVPICLDQSTINRVDDTLSTSNPGVEWQTVFANLWDTVNARPSRALLSGADFKQLNEAIHNSSGGSNYRLQITQTESGNVTVGNLVSSLINETTGGGDVTLSVHAYLPQGVSPVLTDQLPAPSEGVTDIWEVRNVQDVMAIEWPVLQFSYDASTYQYGTFICRAPEYQSAVAGITKG